MYSQTIINGIQSVNPQRSHTCLRRRLLKVLEEIGETSEAYLATTAENNYKEKTWADFREESCDTLIVMVDIALTALPDCGWPPVSFLSLHIDEGRREAVNRFEDMETMKFEVVRSICSAEHFLGQKDGAMGFYGAIGRGVKAAAKLCYAKIPNYDNGQIEYEVQATIKRKIDKWRGRSTAKTPVGIVSVVGTVADDPVDAKTYFEAVRDRHL